MMEPYDFDRMIERRGTNSLKWDTDQGVLPMWVADMDFPTAPEITAAIVSRAQSGIFGYETLPADWHSAIQRWWSQRHQLVIQKEWLIFCTGVVPAISSVIRKLTTPGEKVLVQSPVYNIFYNSIVNNGRLVEHNVLRYDGMSYHVDFNDLEEKLRDPQVTLLLLCNPHNPVGKIWDRETLGRIGSLCKVHHVLVLSDEIHCDLTDPSAAYVPFASVSEDCARNSVTCVAPTKAFNLAGLQTAAVIVPDAAIRHKVWRGLNTDEVAEPNSFAAVAAAAAFGAGGPWLDSLRAYLYENKRVARDFIARELPQITVTPSEATYLLWLDCRRVCPSSAELSQYLRENAGLWLSAGREYGESGEGFLRMNAACPRARLQEGLLRLKQGITDYEALFDQ